MLLSFRGAGLYLICGYRRVGATSHSPRAPDNEPS